MRFLPAFVAIACLRPFAAQAQDKVDPKTQAIVDALMKILPEHEKAADELEQCLLPFSNSRDAKVTDAVDAAWLQILSLRSVRRIIAEQPGYLLHHIGPSHLPKWKEGAEYYLACAKAGKDPFAGMTRGERPFRSKIDGQLLLYRFSLPKDYDPARKYPLRVYLHSGGGFSWLAGWVTGKPESGSRNATPEGAIQINPGGRQHIGMGEIAVLEAIADAKRHFAVDEDRVVIGGASYGGTGGFHFGAFQPDHFAAAHSLTGGGNYSLPVGDGRYDAYLLADNLSNLPFLIWDATGEGHYKANHAFADDLRRRAEKFPGFYPHLELTDPKGGHGVIDRKLQEEGWAWIAKQARNRHPKLAVFKTHWLRYDGAYWARIDTVEDAGQPARIEARMMAGEECRVAVENVDRFHLDLAQPLVGSAKSIEVRINGGDSVRAPAGTSAFFWKTDGKWALSSERYPPGLIKRRGLSGPIQDVFMEHPVLMVFGTAQGKEKSTPTKMLDDIVNRLISTGDGSGVLRTGFERKADGEVNDQDLAEKNLIVVGTPKQNQLLARMADRLPVVFLEDGVKVGGKEHRGSDVGLIMVYPNPLNPKRYVLLVPEAYRGGRPLDYPDYVVMQAPKDGKGAARILAKGTFDGTWK